jgi:hypothetical protein
MRIQSSQVSYVATHAAASTTAVIDETLVRPRAASVSQTRPPAGDQVRLSNLAGSTVDRDDLQDLDPKQRLAILAIEALLGRQIRWLRSHGAPVKVPTTAAAATVRQHTEIHSESELTTFQARGSVETADGRRIDFAANLKMHREFQSYSVTTEPANTTDPLVINFGGSPAQLTEKKIAFDLNSDGAPEQISFVGHGSGFLALDKNGDGKVNDGSELFGPHTGNGFQELAAYDADLNGWIDENDPVYAQLRIWTQDGLSTLSEKGIGAINTSSVDTPFALKDSGNSLQANIRASGIYLSESGAVNTVQQLDLA